jgi:hypothetical protein
MKYILGATSLVAVLAFAGASVAAPLYVNNFDVDDTANWTVNNPALSDIVADFFYDYSAIGVPAAPGGATTRGLKMTANNTGGVFSGFSVSPTGKSFSGTWTVKNFDLAGNHIPAQDVQGVVHATRISVD